jgi:hypothetical protein
MKMFGQKTKFIKVMVNMLLGKSDNYNQIDRISNLQLDLVISPFRST